MQPLYTSQTMIDTGLSVNYLWYILYHQHTRFVLVPENKLQILANLGNFAYDPINYEHFRQLNILDLFIGIIINKPNNIIIVPQCWFARPALQWCARAFFPPSRRCGWRGRGEDGGVCDRRPLQLLSGQAEQGLSRWERGRGNGSEVSLQVSWCAGQLAPIVLLLLCSVLSCPYYIPS